jgi:putative endonuclease
MWRRDKGVLYERKAEAYLKQQGLRSIARNFHCRFGEIDLIMFDREWLCFIEVKYRNNNAFGGSAYSIPTSKRHKLIRSALSFVGEHPQYTDSAQRFDALLIQAQPIGNQEQIRWIRNAFDAEGF